MTARSWEISLSNPPCSGTHSFSDATRLIHLRYTSTLRHQLGLKNLPSVSGAAEFIITGSKGRTIRLWSPHGTFLRTLAGHDSWVRALVFRPEGKYLLSSSHEKTLRCWDLGQEGKCVKIIGDTHEQFITCLKWAPGITRHAGTVEEKNESNGTKMTVPGVQVRCVVGIGS
ncbi:WD40 repeat-like protein [Glarea lozoyensis ATCC 20868]|uniref:WD40 repeat-like protein n=1 Tax=Glarea lozoyensis (strain ATCC 20868 / MF5171) TaxID=1116229 RepID=S3DQM8_GLAL2|nr:WD40 repeat-like protein [Glarea lozoyensis ATCC 20868]EPE34321.1 WD40 repeat-like protein [Glarea lozoyensis ATCC 20868]